MHEKTIEVPQIQVEEMISMVPKISQTVVASLVLHLVQTVEMVKTRIIQKTVLRKRPLIQESIT